MSATTGATVKKRSSPKSYLLHESDWGVADAPLFGSWEKGEESYAARALWQHTICRQARAELDKAPHFGSVSDFVAATEPPDGTRLDDGLNGLDWFAPEDALHLAFHLGRRVLPKYAPDESRTLLYPFHLRVDRADGDAPKS